MTIIEELREIAQRKCNCHEVVRMFGFACGESPCTECIPRLIGAISDRIDAERALPEGIEWPRFEDGELVKIGDEVEFEGEAGIVACIRFELLGWSITLNHNLDLSYLSGAFGERVKRPTPKVLDADGAPIEVGDTVWTTYGYSHQRVVSAVFANGSEEYGIPFGIPAVRYASGGWDRANSVTHERPDSWERIEEDAKLAPRDYLEKRGMNPEKTKLVASMMADLVCRAKALAKAGEQG